MVQQPVKELVYRIGALWAIGVDNRDDLAPMERFSSLQNNRHPFEFLEGLIGPQYKFPECQLFLLDHVLDYGNPTIVFTHLFPNCKSQGLGNSSTFLADIRNLAVEPADL